MARIPEEEIERLKHEVSVLRLVESAGVALKKHGADYHGRCPFHDDKTPSLVVSPQKNLWHCLGACQTGGSVIDWVMKAQGVSFRHAVELLRSEEPVGVRVWGERVVKHAAAPRLAALLDGSAEDQALACSVFDYYHATLKQSPECLAYLDSRGLKSAELIDTFKLGFANRTLGYRLPSRNSSEGQRVRERLEALGLLRDTGHEHFNGSLVVPITDEHGVIIEAYGRKITKALRPGTPLHLYLPGPHRGVWNEKALAVSREIILCEALIDAMTFWVHGFRNVTASYGVEGFTADHLAAFKKYGTERVLIAYDRDDAGDKAAEKLASQLTSEGIECFRIQFPKGMDANEYAQKVQPAAKILGLVIRKAIWLGKGHKIVGNDFEQPQAGPQGEVQDALRNRPKVHTAAAIIEESSVCLPTVDVESAAKEESAPPALAADPVPAARLAADRVPATVLPAEILEPPASPLPPMLGVDVPCEVKDHEVILVLGDRRYRVRGLEQNTAHGVMKINLLVNREEAFHVDTFDLAQARQRAAYIKQAALELGLKDDVIKKDLGKVLLKLEQLQDEKLRQALEPKEKAVSLTDPDKAAALELLKDPELLSRILADFTRCGVVGEETNKLVGYLAAVSRKLEKPLAVLVQSSSAAGKSSLMEAVLAFMPEEEQVNYSAMTGQALFYMGEANLKHKILAIAEEEGAARASYALKLLQSEGELNIASTGKDPVTGRLETQTYRVEGPVMLFSTTTAIDVDEELLNRCLVLSIDEGREQTRAIHAQQRKNRTLAGLHAKVEKKKPLTLHQNAQRLLRPLHVLNPYIDALTFVDDKTRTRRDHEKYLGLIDVIALLHQYQRDIKSTVIDGERVEYIDVTLEDIAAANRIAHEVLGRTLDELPPQTRLLLHKIEKMVSAACAAQAVDRGDYRFSRKEIRDYTQWGNTQLKIHLHRLEELEYLLVHRGGRGQSFVYELLYDGRGKDGASFLMGRIDVNQLRYDEKKSGGNDILAGSSRPQAGVMSGDGRDAINSSAAGVPGQHDAKSLKNASLDEDESGVSYGAKHRSASPPALAAKSAEDDA